MSVCLQPFVSSTRIDVHCLHSLLSPYAVSGFPAIARLAPPFLPSLRLAMASTSTPLCGLAPIHGLPPRAQGMLYRELLLVHVLLAQIHALLRIPLSIRTTPFMSRVTNPQLRAHLEGMDNTLLLALRLNHTAVHYTHELLTALGLIHIIRQSPQQLEAELEGRTDFTDFIDPAPPRSATTSSRPTRTRTTDTRMPFSPSPTPSRHVPRPRFHIRSRSRSRSRMPRS